MKFYKGDGELQDFMEAYIQLNIASVKSSGKQKERISSFRDEVSKKLSKEDLVEAQKKSKEVYEKE